MLRVGPFRIIESKENKDIDSKTYTLKEYEAVGEEKLVSGSDDFTLFLWKPEKEKKPIGILNILKHFLYFKIIDLNLHSIYLIFSKNDWASTIN